jgi:flavorubredoxin
MPPIEIRPDVYWIGVNDRTTDLFEGLWPIAQEGVSYNAYLINDEKKVLVDLVKGLKTDEFFDQVAGVVDLGEIDYVVINHMEPDHTGLLRTLRLFLHPLRPLAGDDDELRDIAPHPLLL